MASSTWRSATTGCSARCASRSASRSCRAIRASSTTRPASAIGPSCTDQWPLGWPSGRPANGWIGRARPGWPARSAAPRPGAKERPRRRDLPRRARSAARSGPQGAGGRWWRRPARIRRTATILERSIPRRPGCRRMQVRGPTSWGASADVDPRTPDVRRSMSQTVATADDLEAVNALFYEQGWTDGLPIIPPTRERVERMVAGCGRPGDALVGRIPPKWGEATIERIAVNSVMAGCRPEHLPVVLAAVEALLDDRVNLHGVQCTTHVTTPLIVVNGP